MNYFFKVFFLLGFFGYPLFLYGQVNGEWSFENKNAPEVFSQTKTDYHFFKRSSVSSKTKTVEFYSVFYKGHEVKDAFIQVIKKGNRIFYTSFLPTNLPLTKPSVSAVNENTVREKIWNKDSTAFKEIDYSVMKDTFWTWSSNQSWQLEERIQILSLDSRIGETAFWGTGEIQDLRSHAKDSSFVSLVFRPDPLSKAQKNYGHPLSDRGDSTFSALDSLYDTTKVYVEFKDDTFFFANKYISIEEFDPPIQPICFSTKDTLFFSRDTTCFEQVNVLFHVSNFQNYLKKMGYDTLCKRAIKADASGQNGADISSYSSNYDALSFGIGGVDDAEDADVIIHEYTHALHHELCPNTNLGMARRSLEEGNCDYLAAVWSSKFTTFNGGLVYNWDGHNEFWSGRSLLATKKFPTNYIGSLYHDSEIWSAALWDLGERIGHDTVAIILLESLNSYYPNMIFREAARLWLQSDTLLFAKRFSDTAFSVFLDRGLVEKRVDIQATFGNENLLLSNSLNFQFGEPVFLELLQTNNRDSQTINFQLFNASGQEVKIEIEKIESNRYSITSPSSQKGLYILVVNTQESSFSFKLIK